MSSAKHTETVPGVCPTILNKYFKVVSYNGGSVYGASGIAHLLNLDAKQLHSTRNGQNFDLVLEYVGPEGIFTLTNFVNLGYEYKLVTAPLKTSVVWVSGESQLANKDTYNDASAAKFVTSTDNGDVVDTSVMPQPVPAIIATTSTTGTDSVASVPLGTPATIAGKYLHIKFTERYGNDVNIDMGHFAIVGYPGSAKPEAWKNESKSFEPTAADYRYLISNKIARPVPIAGVATPLHSAFSDAVVDCVPFVCFISPVPTRVLGLEKANPEDPISQAFDEYQQAAAKFKGKQVPFLTVGPDSERALVRTVFQRLGLPYDHIVADANENRSEAESFLESENERERLTGYSIIPTSVAVESQPEVGEEAIRVALKGSSYAVVAMSASDESKDEDAHVYHLAEQQSSSISTFVEQFVEAYESGVDEEELLGSSNFEKAISAALAKAARDAQTGEGSGEQGKSSKECALARHVFATTRFEADKHPLLPGVYMGVHSNFDELVVNHADPVLFVQTTGAQLDSYVAAHACAFAGLLAKHAPAGGVASRFRVVVWNVQDDDLPDNWSANLSGCDLIVKLTAAKDAKAAKARTEKYGKAITTNNGGLQVYVQSLMKKSDNEEEDDELAGMFDDEDDEGQQVPTVLEIFKAVQEHLQLPKGKGTKQIEMDAEKASQALENLNAITDGGNSIIKMIECSLRPRRRFNASLTSPDIESKNTDETSPSIALKPDPESMFGTSLAKLNEIRSKAHAMLYTVPFPLGRLPIARAVALSQQATERKTSEVHVDIVALADSVSKLREESDQLTKTFTDLIEKLEEARETYKRFLGLFDSFADALADAMTKTPQVWKDFLKKFARLTRATGMPVYNFSGKLAQVLESDAGITVQQAYDQALPYHVVSPVSIANAHSPLSNPFKEAYNLCSTLAEQAYSEKLSFCQVASGFNEVMRIVEGYVNPKPPVTLAKKGLGPKKAAPVKRAADPKVPNAAERLVVVFVHSVDDGSVARLDEIASQMQGILASVKEYNESKKETGDTEAKDRDVVFVRVRGDKAPKLVEHLNISTLPAVCYLQASAEHMQCRIEGVYGLSELATNANAIFDMEEGDLLDEDDVEEDYGDDLASDEE